MPMRRDRAYNYKALGIRQRRVDERTQLIVPVRAYAVFEARMC